MNAFVPSTKLGCVPRSQALRPQSQALRPRPQALRLRTVLCCGLQTNHVKSSPKVFMIIGGPGCGKGTQCRRLAAEFDLRQVTMGDLLRAEAAKGTPEGNTIRDIIDGGNIVPGEMAMRILGKELQEIGNAGTSGVLLDGFPRSLQQMREYEKAIGHYDLALAFECTPEILMQRLMQRSENSDRADDNEQVIRVRIQKFLETMSPLQAYLEAQKKLVSVDGTGSMDAVYQSAYGILKDVLSPKTAARR